MTKNRKQQSDYSTAYFEKVGVAVGNLARAFEGYRDLSVEPTGMSIRPPLERNGEYLLVFRALDDEGAPIVSFHSALDLGEALRGLEARLSNGTLKWRADEFVPADT